MKREARVRGMKREIKREGSVIQRKIDKERKKSWRKGDR
jgi:hypothetical protein